MLFKSNPVAGNVIHMTRNLAAVPSMLPIPFSTPRSQRKGKKKEENI